MAIPTYAVDISKALASTKKLGKLGDVVVAKASRSALNKGAWLLRKYAVRRIRRNFVLRNTWTERTVQYRKTTTLRIASQETRVGSLMEYMREQHFGGVKHAKGRIGIAQPTGSASGEAARTYPRLHAVRRKHYRSRIRLLKPERPKTGTKTSKLQAMINQAAEAPGRRYVYLNLGRTRGIFFISGGIRRKPGQKAKTTRRPQATAQLGGNRKHVLGAGRRKYNVRRPRVVDTGKRRRQPRKLELIYSLNRQAVRIKKTEWLQRPRDSVLKQLPGIYAYYLRYYTKRLRR